MRLGEKLYRIEYLPGRNDRFLWLMQTQEGNFWYSMNGSAYRETPTIVPWPPQLGAKLFIGQVGVIRGLDRMIEVEKVSVNHE